MELKFNNYKEFKNWFKKEIDAIGETISDNIQFIDIRHLSYMSDKLETRSIIRFLEVNYGINLVDKITNNSKSIEYGFKEAIEQIKEKINDSYAAIDNALANIKKEKMVSTRLDTIMSGLIEIFNNYSILELINKQMA